jgi:hypothetical protein
MAGPAANQKNAPSRLAEQNKGRDARFKRVATRCVLQWPPPLVRSQTSAEV